MVDAFYHGVQVVELSDGLRPIQTVDASVIGLIGTAPDADDDVFPVNKPVLISGSRAQAAKLGLTGTLPDAIDSIFDQTGASVIVVRVEPETDEEDTMANIIGGVDPDTGDYLGIQNFLGAESVTGKRPRILIAPGFTHQRPEGNANPVVADLIGIAERLRSIIVADGPNTNDADAIAYADDFGSSRVYLVDPFIAKSVGGNVVYKPSSAAVAGLIAKTDNDLGFWWSPSNKELNGVIGTQRPIDFVMGDVNSRANLLNENKIATIIRRNGYRLYGNLSLSSDPKWQFLCVRRTADIINDSLMDNHLWAVDRGITKTYISDVTEGVNAYLRTLVKLGAIVGGRCYADPDLNTPANIAAGKVYFDFDFTPVYVAQTVTFRSHLVNDYLEEIFN